ncbi:MAG: asparagine--tRNA ligase [Alphaproteobacteria bacterium]|uniref:Asparagine--tRNA ligase n=1 Tax=Candidatus Nitrobium versatile TaxID=2884831 RepID=A0A953M1E7_9BACT|nr:asparagine--tRNA ligase [Candidatus Nitrobium versatile]
MERVRIKEVLSRENTGQPVTVCGWVRTKRESKGFAFVAVNDGSTQENLQLVVPAGTPAFQVLAGVATGAAVRAEGVLRESPAKGQKVEVEVSALELFGGADPASYPLQKKGHTLEFLREIGHLRPRTNTFGAVFRIRNILAAAVHEFFQEKGFIWVHTPILTSNDCEGAGELFTVTSLDFENLPKGEGGRTDFSRDFFGRRAYLTVSGQLEAEFLALALGNVYTFGPTFRAENSNTSRHLSEFWMIEPEMAFAGLKEDMQLAEDFLRFLCRAALERGESELAFLEAHYKRISLEELRILAGAPFTHITYTDAIKELKGAKETFEFPVEWGLDLQSEHERYLTDSIFKGPVIITDYPREIKAFYMKVNDDGRTVAAMDVLAPKIGEIIGGSQREERLEMLEERMRESGVPPEGLQWYLDLRRFGSAPHAGFGLGFERLVQYITGMANIRDVIPCPRAPQALGF